jgi:hypothetical protein
MLVNKTKQMQVIRIITADGKKDSVNLHGKIKLPPGARVDPDYLITYAQVMTDTKPAADAPKPGAAPKPKV